MNLNNFNKKLSLIIRIGLKILFIIGVIIFFITAITSHVKITHLNHEEGLGIDHEHLMYSY